MPITRKMLAQDDNEDNQWLKVDHDSRYIENDIEDWQFLFGPKSSMSVSNQVLKIAAEFDKNDLNGIRVTGYLYNPATGAISSAASITFNVYLVTTPTWTEVLAGTFTGVQTYNSYFFKDLASADLPSIDFFGGDTIMIEAVAARLNDTYRDRIYINHLGIYDNVFRVRQDVEFLDVTKADE